MLTMVSGYKLQFDEIPSQKFTPYRIVVNKDEYTIINIETDKLIQKEVVTTCTRESRDYISNVFIRPKRIFLLGHF